MDIEDFTINFGQMIKEIRIAKGMSLQALSIDSDIVSDQIQKIESAKHGGVQLETFAKLLSGLKVGLSFTIIGDKYKKLVPVSNDLLKFIDKLFFGLPSNEHTQFLNLRQELLKKEIGKLVVNKRSQLDISQKELAERANISNTTVVRLESGEYNFRLSTLYKVGLVLNN